MGTKERCHLNWKAVLVAAVLLLAACLTGCRLERPVPPSPAQQLVQRDPHGSALAIIEQFDVDSDGRISADEFALATIQIFEASDKNGNLKLDREDLGIIGEESLASADTNSDGAISLSEIMRDQDQQVKNYDLNGDSYLGLDELEKFAANKLSEQQVR